jgi:TldD protein
MEEARDVLTKLGVTFGDIRAVEKKLEWLQIRNDSVETASDSVSQGFGVRALVGDAWGYVASPILTRDEVIRCAHEAVRIAQSTRPSALRTVDFGLPNPQQGTWHTPVEIDPFDDMRTADKIDRLMAISKAIRKTPNVMVAKALQLALRCKTELVSTEGTEISQEVTICGGGISATAEKAGEIQQRAYPKHFEGNIQSGGWERFEALGLEGASERVAQEAVALCTAPVCPTRKDATIILDGNILSLQIHESCGHPTELDRAFGEEISLAGGSFLTPDRLQSNFHYGSELVTLFADATTQHGSGTFGWDDEGTPAHRTDLVRNGRFAGYLSGRAAAQRIGLPSAGALRAQGWRNIPIVRMINVNLEPGTWALDDLIADTDDGFLIDGSKSWSIDDRRVNFQFGCELAREIKGGKLGQIYRNPVYTGITPTFWRGCDAICNADHWNMWGYLNCGKGDPMQLMYVGHGAAPARFRGVEIGTT